MDNYDQTETKCKEFTKCSDIPYQTQLECYRANSKCYYYSGNTCSDFSCSKFTLEQCNQANCYISGESCLAYTDCSQVSKENCNSTACWFDQTECRKATCSDFFEESICYFLYDIKSQSISPCTYNGQACVIAENSTLFDTPYSCQMHTGGLYYWSTQTQQCEACVVVLPAPDPIPTYSLVIIASLMLAIQ